jgi:anti-sigma factor RsiW
MNCDDYRQFLSAFVDGELGNAESRQLYQHLGACDECWKHYRRIGRLREVLAAESSAQGAHTESRRLKRPARSFLWIDQPPERQWLKQRLTVSPASFLLSSFVAFLVGMLLMLMLSSRNSATGPGLDDQWSGGQRERSSDYLIHTTTSHVTPPTRRQ